MRVVAGVVGALISTSAAGVLLWICAGGLSLLVMLVTLTPIVGPPARALVRVDVDTGFVDAVVVLSGSFTDDGRLSGQVIDRLLTGLQEVQKRRVSQLALSVVAERVDGRMVSSEADQRALVAMLGVPVDLRFVRDVRSTRDEALAFAAMARTHQWNRVLLVTSPTHTRRACRALEVAGLTVQCTAADPRDYSLKHLRRATDRLLVFQDVLYEFAATILYRARGWN